jgi:hypothetical protein
MNAWQSSMKMIIALIGLFITYTAAFMSPQPLLNTVPVSIAQEEQRQQPQNVNPSNSHQQKEPTRQQQHRPVSYSLGLGKNSAVGYSSASGQNDSIDIIEAVQHWSYHEAVNEFPNPALVARARASILESTTQTSTAHAATNTRKKSMTTPPRIIPQRFFRDQFPITTEVHHQQQQHGDVLDINNDRASSIPTMKSRKPVVRQFDLNTPWVEMLIYEQQQVQFATCGSCS